MTEAMYALVGARFRGGALLDAHATVDSFSNCIGVSMPRLLWRRCRLWRSPGTQRSRWRARARRRRPGGGARKIDPYAHLIDAWLAKQPKLKAVTIYERLVAEHGFDGHYQRVKVYVRENRERLVGIPADPPDLHRRFEVLAGAQAQVDWGDEGEVQTAGGPLHAFSFHMVLSYSRDPFCCYRQASRLV
jgi:transposase